MINNESIHIAVASNNDYSALTAALLKSIIFNHINSRNIVFYILSDNITIKNKEKINQVIDHPSKYIINWIDQKNITKGIKFPIDNSAYPFTAFLRLFAPFYIPADVSKLIYFDVDMIVRKDVSDLWNIDLNNYPIAAVVDIAKVVSCEWSGIPNYKQLGLAPDAKYFNSGLMIINTTYWRENNIALKVLKVMQENLKFVNYADQYGLNIIFAKNWKEINPLWNWFAHEQHPDPYVIHFINIKPIFKSYKSNIEYRKEFFYYLNLTAFKGIKLKSEYERLFKKVIIKIKKKLLRVIS